MHCKSFGERKLPPVQERAKDPEFGPSSDRSGDLEAQRIVLTKVLALHPTNLTLPDLITEISAESADVAKGDRIEQAVSELADLAILSYLGDFITPSPAAIHFNELTGR